MRSKIFFLLLFILLQLTAKAQNKSLVLSCSEKEILKKQFKNNPNAVIEIEKNELFTKNFIEQLKKKKENRRQSSQYIIPVVLHVFHDGDDGRIDIEQAQSGIDILNVDFNGLNQDWNSIDPLFDPIKATLNIQFCLATIDPMGNPTTGVIYHEDPQAMLNIGDLFQHAWDNYKYLNIYLPKYTEGEPSLFTAYAYYPSTFNTDNNIDGIFYSSIRWGYGNNSELDPGQEWASVGTHEVGHWLNLRHTFRNSCSGNGDFVDDTPPTDGGTIELSGCYNYDYSCGEPTNGENYMNYNHDCKKMFTQGQVDRMTAALQLPSRSNLWSLSNLVETGCQETFDLTEIQGENVISIYPNPAGDYINFNLSKYVTSFMIYDLSGKLIYTNDSFTNKDIKININKLESGIYIYHATFEDNVTSGKFIKE